MNTDTKNIISTEENSLESSEESNTGKVCENQNQVQNLTDTAGQSGLNTDASKQKLFTQAQLETLLSERMKRERKNARALNSVKELLKQCKQNGIIAPGSYSDMAKQLTERLGKLEVSSSEVTPQKNEPFDETTHKALSNPVCDSEEVSEVESAVDYESVSQNSHEDENTYEGETTDENKSDDGENTDESFEETQDGEQVSKTGVQGDENPVAVGQEDVGEMRVCAKDIFDLKNDFPDADINEIFSDGTFRDFAKDRRGNLRGIYSDYISFMQKVSGAGEYDGAKRRDYSGAASTAFSSDSKAYTTDYSQRLTRRQMDIANQSGMSYREYGELLNSIPASPKRNLVIKDI